MFRYLLTLCFLFSANAICFGQEDENISVFKNQISSNFTYLILASPNITYERILGNNFSIGLSGVKYGNAHQDLDLPSDGYRNRTNYEVNPFGRWYINGAQRNSQFLELITSFNEIEQSDRTVRIINDMGYGVYTKGSELHNNFGLGIGYGFRLLLLDNKLVLEAQFGLRTNFVVNYFIYEAAIVRTGIRAGYRF